MACTNPTGGRRLKPAGGQCEGRPQLLPGATFCIMTDGSLKAARCPAGGPLGGGMPHPGLVGLALAQALQACAKESGTPTGILCNAV